MSWFFIYFESKNVASTNYNGFIDVGRCSLPDDLYAGKIEATFEGHEYVGQVVSDRSGLSVNDFFRKGGDASRRELFDFVEGRLKNDCVIANLVAFIAGAGSEGVTVKALRSVTIGQLPDVFSRDLLRDGYGIRITP